MATVLYGDFEWDEDKARSNVDRHGVTFEEAASVFLDLDYLLLADPEAPERFIALGFSRLSRVLVVVHCERAERLRIISARLSTRRERECYERRASND